VPIIHSLSKCFKEFRIKMYTIRHVYDFLFIKPSFFVLSFLHTVFPEIHMHFTLINNPHSMYINLQREI